jgi:hypothetical protein
MRSRYGYSSALSLDGVDYGAIFSWLKCRLASGSHAARKHHACASFYQNLSDRQFGGPGDLGGAPGQTREAPGWQFGQHGRRRKVGSCAYATNLSLLDFP